MYVSEKCIWVMDRGQQNWMSQQERLVSMINRSASSIKHVTLTSGNDVSTSFDVETSLSDVGVLIEDKQYFALRESLKINYFYDRSMW